MNKTEFEEWHKASHSGIEQNTFESYCAFIHNVETELGKVLEDYPIDKPDQCLYRISKGEHFTKESEKELSNYKAAVRKYWDFRHWRKRHTPLTNT